MNTAVLKLKSNADGNQSWRHWRANNLDDRMNKFDGVAVKVCNYEVFMMFKGRRPKMNQLTLSIFFVTAGLAGSFENAQGQAVTATVQTAAPRVAAGRSAPATAARNVAAGRVAAQGVARPTGLPQ